MPSDAKGGVSFPWQPRAVQGKTAACLSYSVLLPADFDFHEGGYLPGILGAESADDFKDGFTALLAWRRNGRIGVTTWVDTRSGPVEIDPWKFPAGRWVKLEEEVILNDPRGEDGVLRVWVDGNLAIDRSDIVYRDRPDVTITGVGASVHYGYDDAAQARPRTPPSG